jgi:hypothetical protein
MFVPDDRFSHVAGMRADQALPIGARLEAEILVLAPSAQHPAAQSTERAAFKSIDRLVFPLRTRCSLPRIPRRSSAPRAGFWACSRRTFVIRIRQTDTILRRSIILPSTSPITWSVLKFELVGVSDPVRERY